MTMAYWLYDVWYLDDDGVLAFQPRGDYSYAYYGSTKYPEYRWTGETKREDRYKPGHAEGK